MNINAGMIKGSYDAYNLNDGRVDAPIDAIPTFMAMHLDRSLLRPANGVHAPAKPLLLKLWTWFQSIWAMFTLSPTRETRRWNS